jgi:hypothetical protein
MGNAAQQREVVSLNEHRPTRDGVVRSTLDFGAGVAGRLVAVAWKRTTQAADISFTSSLLKTAHAGKSQPLVFLQFVPATAQPPASREREAVAKLLSESAGILSHSATVYVGQGFRAAMVRSIIIGINALARQPYPIRIFSTLSEAASWIEHNRADLPARLTTNLVEAILGADSSA